MTSKMSASLAAISAATMPAAAIAAPPQTTPQSKSIELGYFLPQAVAAANFSQRLVSCPTSDDPRVRVISSANIKQKTVPDYVRMYRIDARAGFLVKRSTELNLTPDGQLTSINATVEGQGGPVLVAAIKAAAFAGSIALGAPIPLVGAKAFDPNAPSLPRPPEVTCRKTILDKLDERARVAARIDVLEANVAAGTTGSAQADLLANWRQQLAEIDDDLTLSSDPVRVDPGKSGPVFIPALDYAQWFEKFDNGSADDPRDRTKLKHLPGRYGMTLSWNVSAPALAALATNEAVPQGPTPDLYYRRPVPVAITLAPCKTASTTCAPDESGEAGAMTASASVGFPQLSGLFRVPIGRGGLFGSRSVAATFDATGAPTQLKYGSEPGAADIASAVDAARDAGTTLRDARKNALADQAAMLQSRKDIRDLDAELNKPAS